MVLVEPEALVKCEIGPAQESVEERCERKKRRKRQVTRLVDADQQVWTVMCEHVCRKEKRKNATKKKTREKIVHQNSDLRWEPTRLPIVC